MTIEFYWIYIYGWLVAGNVICDEITPHNVIAAYIVALAWPVVLVSRFLKKALR